MINKSLQKKFLLLVLFANLLCMNGFAKKSNTNNSYIHPELKEVIKLVNFANTHPTIFHIFTHGKPGLLLVDNEWLTFKEIETFIQNKLPKMGISYDQINIYACNFAKGIEGQQAVFQLENILGTPVAASTNVTGMNGDWILEHGNTKIKGLESYAYNLQDIDSDGIDDVPDLDADNDGILDSIEGSLDPDNDGVPNWFDLDSDGDAIPDNIEAQLTRLYKKPIGDSNNNGLDDAYDSSVFSGSTLIPTDTDGDGIPDFLDVDSDDDGKLDRDESGLSPIGIAGINGLDNAITVELFDNYDDPNGLIFEELFTDEFSLADSDGDIDANGKNASPTRSDFDYRDRFVEISISRNLNFNDEGSIANCPEKGETFTLLYQVENTGDVSVNQVTVADSLVNEVISYLSGDSNGNNQLDNNETWTFQGMYELDQPTVDSKFIPSSNIVAEARDALPVSNVLVKDGFTSMSIPMDSFKEIDSECFDGSMSLIKTGIFMDQDGNSCADIGDKITYSFKLKNNGVVTLSNVILSDAKIPSLSENIPSLSPQDGELIFTAEYDIDISDLAFGSVENTAKAVGKNPDNDPVEQFSVDNLGNAVTTVALPCTTGNSNISIIKTGVFQDDNNNGCADIGEKINYEFKIKNIGDITLRNIQLTDTKLGITDKEIVAKLLPNEETDFSGPETIYEILIFDLAIGKVENTAKVKSINFNNVEVAANSIDENNIEQPTVIQLPCANGNSTISIEKTGIFQDLNNNGCADVDEEITYEFKIKNTGDITLRNIQLTDMLLNIANLQIANELLPREEMNYSDSAIKHKITLADLAAGNVENMVTVTSINFAGDEVNDDFIDVVDLPCANGSSSISITKTGVFEDVNNDGCASIDDQITYSFVIKNTGDITLRNILLSDPLLNISDKLMAVELLPRGEIKYTNTDTVYTIELSDLENGKVDNTATVSSINYQNLDINASSTENNNDNPTTVALPCTEGNSSLKIVKSGNFVDNDSDSCASEGEEVFYSFTIKNDGEVTLRDVKLTDNLINVSDILVTDELLPGKEIPFVPANSYKITLTDLANGFVSNTATVSAIDYKNILLTFNSVDQSNNLTTQVDLPCTVGKSDISIVKTGQFKDLGVNECAAIGKIISYDFKVTNIGEVSLREIKLTDDLLGISFLEIEQNLILDPGESTSYQAEYTIDFEDILAGEVVNNATVSALNYQNDPPIEVDALDVEGNLGALVDLPCDYDLGVSIGVDNERPNVGDQITFTIVVENVGGIPASNIILSDDLQNVFTYVSNEASSGFATPSGSVLNWNIPSLTTDEKASLMLTVLVNDEEIIDVNDYFTTATITNSQGLIHTDINPANDTDTKTLQPMCVKVYNLISPALIDGKNDFLEIRCIKDDYPNNKIEIFNRWGRSVYSKRGYGQRDDNSDKWYGRLDSDGNSGGEILPAGTYFYILELNDNMNLPITGWIQIE